MKFIVDTLTKIDAKFDKMYADFVTKDVLEEKLKVHQMEIFNLKKQVNELQDDLDDYKEQQREDKKNQKQALPAWVGNLVGLGALIVAVLAIVYKQKTIQYVKIPSPSKEEIYHTRIVFTTIIALFKVCHKDNKLH